MPNIVVSFSIRYVCLLHEIYIQRAKCIFMIHQSVCKVIHFCFPSDYLQQESKDKKGKELDTSGWTMHSKKRNVSPKHMRYN